MDENMVKFHEKLKELLQYAKNKKNVLEYEEINDFFADLEIDANQMEKIYDYLEKHNVDVLREQQGEVIDGDIEVDEDELAIIEAEAEDFSKIDLSVPEGIGLEDPVRMYLKEIGKVPLLNADEEIGLAQRMENGDADAKKRLCGGQSASCCEHCEALCGQGNAVFGSDPGGQSWPDQGGGEV